MKKHLLHSFFAGLVCAGTMTSVYAQDMNNSNDSLKTSVELSQGYRRDSLKTKVTRDHFSSKKHYKSIDTWTTRVDCMVEKDDMFMKALVGYGDVYDGKLHDHSNGGHHSHHKVKGDYTADFALNFGKRFSWDNGWSVSPTVGYGVYVQDFHTKHHKKDRQKAVWYSPQFGVCVNKSFNDTLNAYFDYTLLYPLNYQGTVHHKHQNKHHKDQENKAYKSAGNIFAIGLDWTFATNWSLKPEIEVMEFFSNGGDSQHRYRLKSADRSSIEYRLVLGYTF